MPTLLKGSCRCGCVRFEVESNTPAPYQLCYCSICRKQQGGGGFAINLGANFRTLTVSGEDEVAVFRAEILNDEGTHCKKSSGERNFCRQCGSGLWLYDPTWPELVHPFASAINTPLPVPPQRTHLMLKYRASWVEPCVSAGDLTFDLYPNESIADWHKRMGMWVD